MKALARSIDWRYVRHLGWQCFVVLLVVITFGCFAGMLGAGPTP